VRIAVCDYSGHPFQVELSRSLAARGHDALHLHFAAFQTPKGNLQIMPEDPPGFRVEGIGADITFDKTQFLRRRFIEAHVGRLFARRVAQFAADVVIGCNMPLDAQKQLHRLCRRRRVPFIFWLQDIYSHAIDHYLSARLGRPGRLIGGYYRHLEAGLLRTSDMVVAISDKFVPALEAWRIGRDRIRVIPNWAPLSEVYPVAKHNAWARQHGLAGKTVALYTGTLGLKHDPALLVETAQAAGAVGLELVVVSEGAAVDWLKQQKRERRIDNLTLLPFQPMEAYPEVLGSGDILLAMIEAQAATFSVPSKILSYLAAGKPIIASIGAENDAAATIAAAGAGMVTQPGDRRAFADAVLALAADPDRRASLGYNARAYAERNFDVEAITDRFEAIFSAIHLRAAPLHGVAVPGPA
jgi:glycosyltransferase involved in cell wall biosynthesis